MEGNVWGIILPYVIIFAVFYFVLILPQRQREKKTKAMLDSLKVGDEILTIGGIYGKIVSIKDDVLTIEVGADKTKLKIARWSVRNLETPSEKKE
ncbi:MAG: preprotein translocase subunit YajC [Clostridiaceae bacterium]|nr:preprotein translocase subunit YajC [Clostridiaceae bacterium]